jgi:hypothetical protein
MAGKLKKVVGGWVSGSKSSSVDSFQPSKLLTSRCGTIGYHTGGHRFDCHQDLKCTTSPLFLG